MSRRRAKSQAERLNDALRRTGVRRRDLAIAMLGGQPAKGQIEAKKSQITKWSRGAGISDENARKLAAAFTDLGHPHTERAFMKSPTAPRSWHQEMAELRSEIEANQRLILEELRKLQKG